MPEERRQILTETERDHIKIKRNCSKNSYMISCYKIAPSIFMQELINDFAVHKHYSGTLLLVEYVTSSHGFGK